MAEFVAALAEPPQACLARLRAMGTLEDDELPRLADALAAGDGAAPEGEPAPAADAAPAQPSAGGARASDAGARAASAGGGGERRVLRVAADRSMRWWTCWANW